MRYLANRRKAFIPSPGGGGGAIGDEYAWWCPSLDGANANTTTVADLSGNGYTGTITGMTGPVAWVSDTAFGGVWAIEALTGDDIVDISDDFWSVSNSPVTVACWVNFGPGAQDGSGALGGRGTDQALDRFNLAPNISNTCYWDYGHTAGLGRCTAASATSDAWHHYILTSTGNSGGTDMEIWIDNISVGSSSDADFPSGNIQFNWLEVAGVTATLDLVGRMDDIRVFNRVITSQERSFLSSSRGGG